MRLLAAAGDIQALISQIRLVTPLTALAQQLGWSLVQRSFHDCTRADLAAADVLIVQRGASGRAWRLQQSMRQLGGAVVYEIDDLLTEIAPHISQYGALQAKKAWLRRCLSTADVVSVSTARLGRELAPLLGRAAVIEVPNHAVVVSDVAMPAFVSTAPVTLLFASSDRMASDFIYPALRALLGPHLRIAVVGPPGEDFAAAGLSVERQPLMARERFIAFARGLPNPLAVIPLEDTRFAACKSAVKWFDYAEAGIPTLCSAVSPYREVIADGVTGGLVPNETTAWQTALRDAVGDPVWRQRVAAAARAMVRRRFTLSHTVDAWQEAVHAARARRAAAEIPPATLGWRLQESVGAMFEGTAVRLRGLNRERLARRQQKTH